MFGFEYFLVKVGGFVEVLMSIGEGFVGFGNEVVVFMLDYGREFGEEFVFFRVFFEGREVEVKVRKWE